MINCRICENKIKPFMSFGKMPIANRFLMEKDIPDEYFFELAPAVCDKCQMFQLIEQPDPKDMFHESYAFFSQTSSYMSLHFKRFAQFLLEEYLGDKNSFVVEIGSNDGVMLKHIAASNIKHLGVEPSANVAKIAIDNGVNTRCTFFNKELASEILQEHGAADIICCANVLCHIPDLNSVAEGVCRLLKPNGLFIFEDPYLGDVIEKTSYDQIYDEHVFLFSVNSVINAFLPYGLEVIDVEPLKVHGGSMRYTLGRRNKHIVSERVKTQIDKEVDLGLSLPITYDKFKRNCELSRENLLCILESLKKQGKRVVGYAATSKSTTVTNYCGLNSSHIMYIVDTTPLKQWKYSPGAHILVKPYEEFKLEYPDYALLFAWNHREEIFLKEDEYLRMNGKWIEYVPLSIMDAEK